MDDELDEESAGIAAPREDDRRAIVEAIAHGTGWAVGEAITAEGVSWRPDLERANPKSALHIHLDERLRPSVSQRLAAAVSAGYEAHVALPLAGLYDGEVLASLAELDAQVHVIEDLEAARVSKSSAVLAAVADRRITVPTDIRVDLAKTALAVARAPGTNARRGRRFEALVTFLLSQVADFDVVERNLRTSTQELDAVVQQRAVGGRCWATLGAPFILVEAKNWSDPVDQPALSAFRIKLMQRPGSVRLGLMFGMSGFTEDARRQEDMFAAADAFTVIFVGPTELEQWVEAEAPDDYLEEVVRRALLQAG